MYKIVEVEKIGKVENPVHPNSDYGDSKQYHVGIFTKEPVVGERFTTVYINSQESGISTSPVTEIIDENTFKTLNSIYKWKIYD